MAADAPWDVHSLSETDLPEWLELDAAAFLIDPPADILEMVAAGLRQDGRLIGVRDPGAAGLLVGIAVIIPRSMTFPGGPSGDTDRVHPVAAVTGVSVRAGWRRRGLLHAMMRHQLHGLHDAGGEPVAILTASSGDLYGRYGYGRAIDRAEIRLPHGAAFAPGTRLEPVRELGPDRASTLRAVYARVAPHRPGHLSRAETDWSFRLSDSEFLRRGQSMKRWAAHPDGYAGYRIRPSWLDRDGSQVLVVQDLCAATPVAHASLWRFLLDLDLIDRVAYDLGWMDDPVQDLLLDRRSLTLTPHDHVWLRIVDLDRAIGLRGYTRRASLDIRIVDEFCPWNAGCWRLDLHPDGGRATRTNASPQVTMNIRDLGACLLGGPPVARLAAAGVLSGDPGAVLELGSALSAGTAPWCPEGF